MPIKASDTVVSLVIDKDYYENTVKKAAKDQDLSANQLIRRAISEYVDGLPRDHRLAKISGIYDKLDDQGKTWLLACAQLAIGESNFKA